MTNRMFHSPRRVCPNASTVLLAFPHLGGGPSSTNELARHLPGDVELRTLNLPGRQIRFAEPNRTDLEGIVRDVSQSVHEAADGRPIVLFGYCSGSLLAWLVTVQLFKKFETVPTHLIVSAFPAPNNAQPETDVHGLPSDEFWSRLIELGGVPSEVADNRKFRSFLEPSLRADFEMFSAYAPGRLEPLPVDITALEGAQDDLVADELTLAWSSATTTRFERRLLPTGHWVLDENPALLATVLTEIALGSSG